MTDGSQELGLTAKDLGQEEKSPEEELLDYLKSSSEYDYSGVNLTSQEVKNAIEWAISTRRNPATLSPAQIILAQSKNVIGTDADKQMEQQREQRRQVLGANRANLQEVLAPRNNLQVHYVPDLDTYQKISQQGLEADLHLGIYATSLTSAPKGVSDAIRESTIERNIKELSSPHQGRNFAVIIDLPALNKGQKAEYDSKKSLGEPVWHTSYFVEKKETRDAGGYDAVLPSKYIKGVVDLNKGKFTPKN